MEEVRKTLRKLKKRKAMGMNKIPNKVWKFGEGRENKGISDGIYE